MNTTNRGANRFLLLVVGLLLLVLGAAAVLLGALPAFASAWRDSATSVRQDGPTWVTDAAVGSVSWLTIAVAALAVIVAVLLIVFIVRQGRGHESAVLERRNGATGRTTVDLAVPRTLLSEHLRDHPDVLASRITAYDVRGVPTLKISVRARRGVSPSAIRDEVVGALHALDAVLGEQVPACLQISGGFRARTASRARVA